MNKWKDNDIQFPRLIAEIEAAGGFTEELLKDLKASMDLETADILHVVDRAQSTFDEIMNPKPIRKLKKVIVSIEILMEANDDVSGRSLHQIEDECLDGGWSYQMSEDESVIIEGDKAIEEACGKQATDPAFFFMDWDCAGEDE